MASRAAGTQKGASLGASRDSAALRASSAALAADFGALAFPAAILTGAIAGRMVLARVTVRAIVKKGFELSSQDLIMQSTSEFGIERLFEPRLF